MQEEGIGIEFQEVSEENTNVLKEAIEYLNNIEEKFDRSK